MEKLDELTEDHSRAPVPESDKIHGFKMALIISNTVVCVPNLLVGSQIAAGAGLSRALMAFFIGGAVLAVMGAITAFVGARANLSTYMIIQFPFGQRGGKIVNLVLLASIIGIYSVIAAVFGGALSGTIRTITGLSVNTGICTAIGSALMILVIIFGFRSLKSLASIAVPLLVTLVSVMLFYALKQHGFTLASDEPHGISAETAISAVIGSYIVGIVVIPDMVRYARSARHGVPAVVFSLMVALPLALSVAAVIATAAGPKDLVQLVLGLGLGAVALSVLTFISWSNNANNLYSSSLVFAAIVPSVPKWKLVVIAGGIGTVLALLPVLDYYIPFLLAIGVLLPPLAGIYASDFFFVRGQSYDFADLGPANRIDFVALVIWGLASGVGFLSSQGLVHLTSLPGLDALLAGFIFHAVTSRLATRRQVRTEIS